MLHVLILSGGTYSKNWIPNDKFFKNTSWQFYLVFVRNLRKGGRLRNIFLYFVLLKMSDLGFESRPHV